MTDTALRWPLMSLHTFELMRDPIFDGNVTSIVFQKLKTAEIQENGKVFQHLFGIDL